MHMCVLMHVSLHAYEPVCVCLCVLDQRQWVSRVPPSLGENQAWHHSVWKANVFGPFPFHFTNIFSILPPPPPAWARRQGNQCQSERGDPVMNGPNQNDTDKGWRSDVGKMWKRSVAVGNGDRSERLWRFTETLLRARCRHQFNDRSLFSPVL